MCYHLVQGAHESIEMFSHVLHCSNRTVPTTWRVEHVLEIMRAAAIVLEYTRVVYVKTSQQVKSLHQVLDSHAATITYWVHFAFAAHQFTQSVLAWLLHLSSQPHDNMWTEQVHDRCVNVSGSILNLHLLGYQPCLRSKKNNNYKKGKEEPVAVMQAIHECCVNVYAVIFTYPWAKL